MNFLAYLTKYKEKKIKKIVRARSGYLMRRSEIFTRVYFQRAFRRIIA